MNFWQKKRTNQTLLTNGFIFLYQIVTKCKPREIFFVTAQLCGWPARRPLSHPHQICGHHYTSQANPPSYSLVVNSTLQCSISWWCLELRGLTIIGATAWPPEFGQVSRLAVAGLWHNLEDADHGSQSELSTPWPTLVPRGCPLFFFSNWGRYCSSRKLHQRCRKLRQWVESFANQ